MQRGIASETLGMVLFLTVSVLLASGQGIITTVAGGGGFFRGDGDAAVRALLGEVEGVAVDRAGNVYACDLDHHLIVKIAPDGTLTVVAGNGIAGFSGDGGPANRASLNTPNGVTVDAAGNLYIADSTNYRIRKVTVDGRIATVAGNGQYGFSGDGGPATQASLAFPRGVAVDPAGNLYIADTQNLRIRKVDAQGIITTVAGSGPAGIPNGAYSGDGGPATSARFHPPFAVAVDSNGNIYVSDSGSNRIRKVNPSGIITTFAGNGGTCCGTQDGVPATATPLNGPWGLTLDAAGNLYFADNSSFIRKIGLDGILTTVAGTNPIGFSGDGGAATSAAMNNPRGVAVDSAGHLYIADSANNRIRRVTGGIISAFAGLGPQSFGDGGPATSAALSRPRGVVLDASGNLYISEARNHRVRKVSPNGVISTVAGNGTAGFSGDGGLAPAASLNQPLGIALDAAGNLYIADQNNGRVRRVTPAGIIFTVAGGGGAQPGDGGPALNASLYPSDVELDAAGNLYVVSNSLNRVQKVDRNGIITTVAGNGTAGFSGDGGAATGASLNTPNGIALDSAGNLYIADSKNFRVRKVDAGGIIRTIAGTGESCCSEDGVLATNAAIGGPSEVAVDAGGNLYILSNAARKIDVRGILTRLTGSGGFSGDGGLALNAQLSSAAGIVLDGAGNLYIADTQNDRVRKILVASPALSLSPSSLSFAATAGSPPSAPQQVTVSSEIAGVAWTVTASTMTGGNWLSVSPVAGSTPGTFAVTVDAITLSPGAYQGTITVTAPLASPPVQTIGVQLTVTATVPAQLTLNAASLTFQILQGTASLPAQFLRIGNAGGGTLAWTAQASTQGGGNWLAVGPASGSASAAFPATTQVTVNTVGLAPGVYSGSVRISAAALQQTQTVTVTLLISQPTQTILLSQSGLLFTGVENAGAAPAQSFGILNIGQGTMSWTVDATTLAGGPWLSVTPASGSSTANSLQIPIIDVRVNLRGLRAGQYDGLIRISATGANNSPQYVMVELTVLPPGSNPGPLVRPTGLIFAAPAGGNSPSSQTVNVATAAVNGVEARGGLQTFDGVSWLDAAPRNSVLSADDARTITVQPSVGALAPGVYRGALTLLFADGSPLQAVNILFLVVGANQGGFPGAAAACVPQKLLAIHRSLGTSFVAPASSPTNVEVQVIDDCGNAVSNATVVTSFSNGDPPLPLASLGNGIYSGTWRPVNTASRVAVSVRADLAPLTATEVSAQGQVTANPTAPALFAAGLVNAANYASGAALPPGGIISVFGRNLAAAGAAASLPLPTTLGGATLSIGGVDVPLFYTSDGQINAQLPFELAPNTRPQAVARRSGVLAVPETITLAAVAPGIFTTNQQGTGQGAILDARGRVVDATSPAAAGEVVQVFCTGLGLTNPRVTTGQPATGSLSTTALPVTATVGGRPATVQFAGLAPGFVGLYQVNVQVPTGVAPGSAVPLVLLENAVPSNSVTLAVR